MSVKQEKKAWDNKYVPINFKVIIVSVFILILSACLLGFYVLPMNSQYLVYGCNELPAVNWMPIVDRYCRELTSYGFPVRAVKVSIFIGTMNYVVFFVFLFWFASVYKSLGAGQRCLYQEINKNGQIKNLQKISIVLILSTIYLLGYGLDIDFDNKVRRSYARLHLSYLYLVLHVLFVIVCYYLISFVAFVFSDYYFMRRRRGN